MSGKHNRRQKNKAEAIRRILTIARKQNLLRPGGKGNFFDQLSVEFPTSTLNEAWKQHFDPNNPTKAERMASQRVKSNRIEEARILRKQRDPTAHNPGKHVARHGKSKNAKAMNKFRASLKPAPPKNKKHNGGPRR